MSNFDQAARATERNAQRMQETAQESWSQFGRGFFDAFGNVREFHLRTVDMLRSNTNASFDLMERLISAKSPDQVMGAWQSFVERQADAVSKHSNELAGMAENAAKESAQDLSGRR